MRFKVRKVYIWRNFLWIFLNGYVLSLYLHLLTKWFVWATIVCGSFSYLAATISRSFPLLKLQYLPNSNSNIWTT